MVWNVWGWKVRGEKEFKVEYGWNFLQIRIRFVRQRSDPNLEQMWLKCSLLEYPALKDDWSKNLGLKSSFWHGIEMSEVETWGWKVRGWNFLQTSKSTPLYGSVVRYLFNPHHNCTSNKKSILIIITIKSLLPLGLKSPELKLGVEKSRVEISCNP